MSVSLNVPAALPCRYYWHTAVPTAARDIRQDDPSVFQFSSTGAPLTTIPSQNKRRPAIGVMCGVTGNLAYIDSRGNTQLITGMIVGTYYPADIQQLVGTTGSNIIPAETGTSAGTVVSSATKITLFWAV